MVKILYNHNTMSTTEERQKILSMIEKGVIIAEQGMALLEAMETSTNSKTQPPSKSSGDVQKRNYDRWLRILVADDQTKKARVNLRLPVSVLSAGMMLGARFTPGMDEIDSKRLMELIQAGETGKIVDFTDEVTHEHVEIWVE